MRAIPYWSATAYMLFLRILHGRDLDRRYSRVAELVGEEVRVFEPGCGPAILARYLRNCEYVGWDLNAAFVKAARRRGLRCELKDCTAWRDYPKADVIVMIDFLHHIIPHHREVLRGAMERAGRVVICEPAVLHRVRLPRPLRRAADALVGDSDGINPYHSREGWETEFKRLLAEHSERIIHAEKLGDDIIVVFRGEGGQD